MADKKNPIRGNITVKVLFNKNNAFKLVMAILVCGHILIRYFDKDSLLYSSKYARKGVNLIGFL